MNPLFIDEAPTRQIICDWPGVSVAFCEYKGGEVAVAIRYGERKAFGSVLDSLPEAVDYAQKSVRFARMLFKVKGEQL